MSEKKLLFRTFGLIKVFRKTYWISIFIATLLMLSVEILYAFASKYFIVSIENQNIKLLIFTSCMAFGVILLRWIDSFFEFLTSYSVRKIMLNIRCDLFAHMEKLDVSYYEINHSGDTISRLANDVEPLKTFFAQDIPEILTNIAGLIGNILLMMYFDFKLGLVVLGISIIYSIFNIYYSRRIKYMSSEIQVALSDLNQKISNILAGFKVLKIYRSKLIYKDFYQSNDNVADLRMDRYKTKAALDGINYIIYILVNFGVIVIAAVMAFKGEVSFGNIVAIISLQETVSYVLLHFGTNIASVREKLACSERIFEILDKNPEIERYNISRYGANKDGAVITFDNVCFSYDTRDNTLKNINLYVKDNKTIALVGQSGGGKSTIIKLLLGFYEINSGGLYIKNKFINEYTLTELRKMFSYVPQEALLFEGTIYENIEFAKPSATKEEIFEAAKTANAHNFIVKLPDGYDTNVSSRGENLSGGQRQRIVIARAILKDAPILLLDEATSALDSENEILVQKGIENLMKGKTVLVVAHRLSTIKNSDWIYVFENGKIVEEGTHDHLLELGRVYKNLYSKSFSLKN